MQYLFFDFDGTIADSHVGILNGVHYMVAQLGLPDLGDEVYRTFIGPSLSSSLIRTYPQLTEDEIKVAIKHYQKIYSETGIFEMRLFPGLIEVLTQLKGAGYSLNIASAKPEPMIDRIVAHFKLGEWFDGCYGATLDETVRGTKAQVLAYALENAGATPDASLMIGDTDSDIRGGQANHVETLGVTYGFGSRASLVAAGADLLIDRVDELPGAINQLLA
ncbi:HAD hydrolase-like protein [Lacticaseibacillus mingshuiensis]|uniref:HAD hydrolase-like protein n=1 Tax=Lacticaseibacillus mingshuiensis TaxID=2799574 RepID=A0ABW4CG46_9LACO|nr:HAD hydrolase-like protein [Lacticaseibacillus mingshuiensis]